MVRPAGVAVGAPHIAAGEPDESGRPPPPPGPPPFTDTNFSATGNSWARGAMVWRAWCRSASSRPSFSSSGTMGYRCSPIVGAVVGGLVDLHLGHGQPAGGQRVEEPLREVLCRGAEGHNEQGETLALEARQGVGGKGALLHDEMVVESLGQRAQLGFKLAEIHHHGPCRCPPVCRCSTSR